LKSLYRSPPKSNSLSSCALHKISARSVHHFKK